MPTKIDWCDETINPIVGCSKISLGCQNCYAEKMAWRLKCMGMPKYQDVVDRNGWTGKIASDLSQFHSLPQKPKKVFIDSMGDLFHDNVKDRMIDSIWSRIYRYPQHTFLILTKRPNRMAHFVDDVGVFNYGILPNLWLGVTVEHHDYLWRIEELSKIPAAVRFVSVEPMLAPIDLAGDDGGHHFFPFENELGTITPGIDWVIAGPETGPGARLCPEGAIEDLYNQTRAAGIPFFDKRKNFIAREFPGDK